MGAASHGGTDARGFDKEFTRWTVPNVETLSGNKTITSTDARVQLLNPGGASRNVTLDASLHVAGTSVYIQNTDGGGAALLVLNSAGTNLVSLYYQYSSCRVIYNGSTWTFVEQPLSFVVSGVRYFGNAYGGLASGINETSYGNTTGTSVRINATGVGIGASPSSLFHVTASGNASALRVDNTSGNVCVGGAVFSWSFVVTNGTNAEIVAHHSGGNCVTLSMIGSTAAWVRTNGTHPLLLGVNFAEYFRIADSGYVSCTGTTGAFSPHRLTTTQRDALTAVNGMICYNSTTDKLQVRAAGAWVDLH